MPAHWQEGSVATSCSGAARVNGTGGGRHWLLNLSQLGQQVQDTN